MATSFAVLSPSKRSSPVVGYMGVTAVRSTPTDGAGTNAGPWLSVDDVPPHPVTVNSATIVRVKRIRRMVMETSAGSATRAPRVAGKARHPFIYVGNYCRLSNHGCNRRPSSASDVAARRAHRGRVHLE